MSARQPCTHNHVFTTVNAAAARNTALVTWITAAAMLAEIVAGLAFNSMALLADGIHMGAYACALAVTTADPALTPDHLRQRLAVHEEVVHATIEVRAV